MKTQRRVLIFIGLLTIVSLMVWWKFYRQNYREELSWPVEKVIASPENTKQYIEARLGLIADKLPAGYTSSLIGERSVKKYLQDFLASGKMDEWVKIIHSGRRMASQKKFAITMIPDIHADTVRGQNEESRTRQKTIAIYLKNQKPGLVFAENIGFRVSWKNFHDDFLETSRRLNSPVSIRFDEFKKWITEENTSQCWWIEFIDDLQFPIVGIDKHTEISTVILLLANMDHSSIQSEDAINTAEWINHSLRDQLLLAITILDMEVFHVGHAFVVLGALHEEPQKHFCKEWGVDFKIIQP